VSRKVGDIVGLSGAQTSPRNLILGQTMKVIVIRELNSNIRLTDGLTGVTSQLCVHLDISCK
jgi:hypothetical protein